MHATTATELNPITRRIAILTAISAGSMLALGFAPLPQLLYLLAIGGIAFGLTMATGLKNSTRTWNLPILMLTALPAIMTIVLRGTALAAVAVPVLAFVVAAATWMVATNRYTDQHIDAHVTDHPAGLVPDELQPKRDEKTAAANDDSSATAA